MGGDSAFAMTERFRRRWLLLVFSTVAVGSSARASAELVRALDCYHARRYSEARSLFHQISLEKAPDAEIEFYLGRLALWFDEGQKALGHLERAVAIAPDDARIQNALGDAYGLAAQQANLVMKLSWARKCRAAYQRAVAQQPRNVAYRWSLFGFYYLAPRLAGGGLEKARAQADEIARLDDMSGRIARATLDLGEENFDRAFSEFEIILKDNPKDFMALYQIGRCSALSGRQIERGLSALQRCLELVPPEGENAPTLACVQHRIGNLLEKKGDQMGAAQAYAAARRLHPDFRATKLALTQ
jgi:tetratricopeptide (TPR) repeat protein